MGLFRQTVPCSHCGNQVPTGARFCPSCGKPASGGRSVCGHCGAQMASDDVFCRQCGRQTASVEPPAMAGSTWSRRQGDFAVRVDVDDVEGFFRRAVVVEPGTSAILIQGGKSLGVMPPGTYTLQNLGQRLGLSTKDAATAILVDIGDSVLSFTLEGLYTTDPVRLSIDVEIVLQLHEPMLLLMNALRSQRSYPLEQLRELLAPEVDNAVRQYVRERAIENLNTSLQMKRDIELDIEAHLQRTLADLGLRLVQVRTLNYRCPVLDETQQLGSDYFLNISRHEAELAGRTAMFDVLSREQVQSLVEETSKVQDYEQRAALHERLRRAVLSDKMSTVRTEEDLETFIQDIDRDRLLRASEMDEFKREFAERKQDHDLARAHLLAMLSTERDYDLKQAELRRRTDFSADQLEAELAIERKRVEGRLALETRRAELEIQLQRQSRDFQREQERLDDIQERERRLQAVRDRLDLRLSEARTQADIDRIEREQDQADIELGMLSLERIKAIQRRDEEERNRIVLDRQARELEIERVRLDAELERRLRLESQQQQFELSRLERLGGLSSEALIAISGPDQARLLAELKTTETLRDMTEEQILARAAEHSPKVAEAFIEKFRQNPELQQQMLAMYERMLEEQKENSATRDEQQRETLVQMRAMFDKALDSQRDIATAYARQQPQGPTVIMPGLGSQQIIGGGGVTAEQAPMKCPQCSRTWERGTRFCPNCGVELV